MIELSLGQAVDRAIEDAMASDEAIVLIGEDVPLLRPRLYSRFGASRVLAAPISESAFLGAACAAAMAGLRPIVELYMVDFIAVAFDSVLNHIAKVDAMSGGEWGCPMVIRAPSGAWYGDGGQHGQSLWGMLAAIPGLTVVVPSTPNDAYRLTRAALTHPGPVVLFEPKLLSEEWLELLGRGGRDTVEFDVPAAGARGDVAVDADPSPLTGAICVRSGQDVTLCSVGVGVHRCLEVASELDARSLSCEVIDLRCLRPLDAETVAASVAKTGRLVVVDEDYRECGLSGELAAIALEAGLRPAFARVCVEGTLPYARPLEQAALPNTARILDAVVSLAAAPRLG